MQTKYLPDADASLGMRLGHVHRLWRAVVDRTVAASGLTQPRWTVLFMLHHMGDGTTQKQLSDSLGVELPSLSRTLAQVEQQGLIVRRTPHGDRRVRQIYFTAAGREMLNTLEARADEVRTLILSGLAPADHEAFHRVLCHIESNAEHWLKGY
ncbi:MULTISPECIES: MarR family transcriptional regulator [Modicisalibacter]|uniref:MarR family transcriptional regulator n=1 Tax=Modicisalibacter tunisiensis TaxID=390637 RepID=A0ABS7X2M0_9GAMM|nr:MULTISPECIES: MarR family transcriptional regulator [Modicisalibacter]MBZ9537431.1 MarR family transcriptional regulator [Modicisalibacter tunisiensis]MBZ9569146.1 MarR family transcriptional regulator [Modicisalibacter tunisiensis]